MDLTTYNSPIINAKIWWQNTGGAGSPNDSLLVYITSNGTSVLAKTYTANQSDDSWQDLELRVSDFVNPE